MSLLMQALRKAERARSHNEDEHEAEPRFGQEAVPSPPPIEGGPAFAVMPDAWRLEPLEAEPPVIAAQEAVHDPVPPQSRHEASRAARAGAGTAFGPPPAPQARPAPNPGPMPEPAFHSAGAKAAAPAPARAVAAPQRRMQILAGALAALVATFALIYWRAVSGPGPGARLPMVPMPAPGAPPLAQTGAQQGAAIPVTPSSSDASGDLAAQPVEATAPRDAGLPTAEATLPQAGAAPPAPASKPPGAVTVPTPAQLAAISDPAIRAEAMRDAAERSARQVQLEAAPPGSTVPATVPHAEPSASAAPGRIPQAHQARRTAARNASAADAATGKPAPPLAVGDRGDVRFVRSAGEAKIAPAVQQGYAALRAGDLGTARQQYDLALLQDPNSRDALLGSAAVALREHDGRQASSNYLRLLELDPNDPDALAGLTGLRPGDLQANEIKLRGLARQHPESGPVQFALGNLYARQGRWPEAQQSYFRAFTAIPDNADYAFNLGVGLDRMNQPRLAQTYYRRALELAQTSPPGFDVGAVRKRLQALETPPQ